MVRRLVDRNRDHGYQAHMHLLIPEVAGCGALGFGTYGFGSLVQVKRVSISLGLGL